MTCITNAALHTLVYKKCGSQLVSDWQILTDWHYDFCTAVTRDEFLTKCSYNLLTYYFNSILPM